MTRDTIAGESETKATSTNVVGAGSLSLAMTANRSSTHARSSVVADTFALRFAAKATAHGTPPLTAGSLFGGMADANMGASCEDSIIITSPSLPSGARRSATARVRLLLDSQGQVTGNTNWAAGSVSADFRLGTASSVWNTNSANGFPKGTVLVDVPVQVDGPNPPYWSHYFLLSANAGASAVSYAEGEFPTATATITLTWGGIVSLKLDDGTVISDFSATGTSGASYRDQRLRTDQTASISQPNTSAIALQWAGTSNMFYQVESASSLQVGDWSPLGAAAEGNSTNVVMESVSGVGNRFYRVVDAPLP